MSEWSQNPSKQFTDKSKCPECLAHRVKLLYQKKPYTHLQQFIPYSDSENKLPKCKRKTGCI